MNTLPEKYVILYDGSCRFCVLQSRRLVSLARPGLMETIDFQRGGALDRFPAITHDACMKAMHLVEPDGRISQGAEAIARALATRPMLRWVQPLYYLPGLRQILDWLYALIASNRYWLWGKLTSQDCDTGTCRLHRS